MSAPIVEGPGRLAPSTSIVGHVESTLRFREGWNGVGMKEPRSCNLRRTRPVGPMILCEDLECFKKCMELTIYEIEKERVELTRYEILKEAELIHD